jgi:deoxyribonuclease-4
LQTCPAINGLKIWKGEVLMLLGAHMSIAGGAFNAFAHGEKFGCTTIQIFTKSSNQWRAKELTAEEVEKYHSEQKRTGIKPVIAHDSYLINLGSPDKALVKKSREAFLIEMQRCDLLKIPYIVTHPGSHLGKGEEWGIKRIAESLDWLHDKTPEFEVKIALETTAGQGTNLGYRFEQIASMIEQTSQPERLAVCMDTCHIFAAGYDITTKKAYEKTISEFDRIIGLSRLAAIHFNDSKKELGSRVDRHNHIGEGFIGEKPFGFFMKDSRFSKIPKILETPKGDDGEMDRINLGKLRKLAAK